MSAKPWRKPGQKARHSAHKSKSELLPRVSRTLLQKERESGLNREQFSAEIGVPESSYNAIISGKAAVSIPRLYELAQTLGISEWELLGVPAEMVSALRNSAAAA